MSTEPSTPTFPVRFGRYLLLERIAQGGMAEIFKAKVTGAAGFEKIIVIKRILAHLAADRQFVDMFIDEAKLTVHLVHPKIVQVLEFGEVDEQYYIALEYVNGLDGLALLRMCAEKKTRVPLPLALHIGVEVLDALDYAHRSTDPEGNYLGIVHRDVSPSNVFISQRGDVKLGDFGIAHASERQSKTQTGTLKGKYGYMSPEQVMGEELDARSDIFAFGIVLAELLMGRRLFTAPSDLDVLLMVRDVRLERLYKYGQDIPPEILEILLHALRKESDERFQNAGEFRDRLHDCLFKSGVRVGATELGVFMRSLLSDAPRSEHSEAKALGDKLRGAGPEFMKPAPDVPRPLPELPKPEPVSPSAGHDAAGPPKPPPLPRKVPPLAPSSAAHPPPVPPPLKPPSSARPEPGHSGQPGQPGQPGQKEPPRPSTHVGTDVPITLAIDMASLDRMAGKPPSGKPGRPANPSKEEKGDDGIEIELSDLSNRTPISAQEFLGLTPASLAEAFQVLESTPLPAESLAPRSAKRGAPAKKKTSRKPTSKSQDVDRPPPLVTEGLRHGLEAATDRGDLMQSSAVRVFYRLALARETGMLRLECGGAIKDIYLKQGNPEYVTSNIAREFFGEYLVSKGVIDGGELSMALAVMPKFGGKLGDTLVGLQLIRPLDVFRYLTQQVRDRLIDVFSWMRGRWQYHRGMVSEQQAFPLGIDAFEILGAGVSSLPMDELNERLRSYIALTPRAKTNPPVRAEVFRMGPGLDELLDKLRGQRPLGQWMEAYGGRPELLTFCRMMFLLIETELVELRR